MGTNDGLVHSEVLELQATPAQVREFIMTPERILDYFHAPVGGGVFEDGRSIWCRSRTGVSMLERSEDESSDDCVVVVVTTAFGLEPPYTARDIEAAATFTMVEDWAVAANPDGTTLTKSWRDVKVTGELPFSLEDAIREAAKDESKTLVEKWNEAARTSS